MVGEFGTARSGVSTDSWVPTERSRQGRLSWVVSNRRRSRCFVRTTGEGPPGNTRDPPPSTRTKHPTSFETSTIFLRGGPVPEDLLSCTVVEWSRLNQKTGGRRCYRRRGLGKVRGVPGGGEGVVGVGKRPRAVVGTGVQSNPVNSDRLRQTMRPNKSSIDRTGDIAFEDLRLLKEVDQVKTREARTLSRTVFLLGLFLTYFLNCLGRYRGSGWWGILF